MPAELVQEVVWKKLGGLSVEVLGRSPNCRLPGDCHHHFDAGIVFNFPHVSLLAEDSA